MIEFEPLGRVGRGERQGSIVAPQVSKPGPGLQDGGAEGREVHVPDGPAEERRRKLGRRGFATLADGVVPEPAQGHEQGLAVGRPGGAPKEGVDQGRIEEELDPWCAERQAELQGDHDCRQQFAVRSGKDSPGRVVLRPGPDRPLQADGLVGWIRREDQPTARFGPGTDPLGEPLLVALDQADGSLHDLARAAVVHFEVDTAEAGQVLDEAQDPPDVGEPPAVDRLVVVADQKDAVGGRRQQQCQTELCSVDVLDLIDEELPAVTAPAGEQGRVRFEPLDGAQDEIVEIEAPGRGNGGLVVHEGPGHPPGFGIGSDRARRDAQLHLESRDDRIEAEQGGFVRPRRDVPQHGRPVGQWLDGYARVAQDLTAKGVERPDPHGPRRDAQRRDGSIEPLGHLDRRPLVEGDRPDRLGWRAGRDQPGRPGDQGRRLSRTGRGDAQRRAGRRGRSGSLVRCESGEPFGDRWGQIHGRSLAGPANPTIIRR